MKRIQRIRKHGPQPSTLPCMSKPGASNSGGGGSVRLVDRVIAKFRTLERRNPRQLEFDAKQLLAEHYKYRPEITALAKYISDYGLLSNIPELRGLKEAELVSIFSSEAFVGSLHVIIPLLTEEVLDHPGAYRYFTRVGNVPETSIPGISSSHRVAVVEFLNEHAGSPITDMAPSHYLRRIYEIHPELKAFLMGGIKVGGFLLIAHLVRYSVEV